MRGNGCELVFTEQPLHLCTWTLSWSFEAHDLNHMRQRHNRAINPDSLGYFCMAVCPPCVIWAHLKSERRGLTVWKGLSGTEESQRTVCFHESAWICESAESFVLCCFGGFFMRLIHHGSGVWRNTLTLCNSLCNSVCCQPFCILLRKHWASFSDRMIREMRKVHLNSDSGFAAAAQFIFHKQQNAEIYF